MYSAAFEEFLDRMSEDETDPVDEDYYRQSEWEA